MRLGKIILLVLFSYSAHSEYFKKVSPKTLVFEEKSFHLVFMARKFNQGEVIVVKLIEKTPLEKLGIQWDGRELKYSNNKKSKLLFIPVDPEYNKNFGIVKVSYKTGNLNQSHSYEIGIYNGGFKILGNLNVGDRFSKKYSKTELAFIKKCTQLKKKAFKTSRDILFSGNFVYPVKNREVNSNFYSKRRYNNRKKYKAHRGVDLKGKEGDPIYAIQDGIVELSREMFFEGIMTILNHGNGIFSIYMHQSKTIVKEGSSIKKGQLIGNIGSTGMSTGPHLHLAVKINGIFVDPLSLLAIRL